MNKVHRLVLWLASLLLVGAALTALTPAPAPSPAVALQRQPPAPTPTATSAPLTITTTALPHGNLCAAYLAFISANQGNPLAPDTWTLVSGVLPAGLALPSRWSYYSTAVDGTPTTLQTTTFTVQVQDSAGATATRSLSLTIDPPLPVQNTSTTPPNASVGVSYSTSLSASGGCQPYTWSIPAGQLPPGLRLSISTSYGHSIARIVGTPTAKGTYSFTEVVTDSTGLQTSKQVSITVT
jgi:hypothetical protein